MNRPILTLTEDFAALGLIEADNRMQSQGGGSQMRPGAFRKREAAVMKDIERRKKKAGIAREDIDDFDGDDLDEVQQVRIKKMRGAGVLKKHHAAHIYAMTHKAQRKKAGRKASAIRSRKFLAHKPKARRGYKRVGLASDVDLTNLGSTIGSLGEGTNTAQLQQAFSNVYKFGRTIGEGYKDLIEQDFISRYVSYPEMMESAVLLAQEAQMFAKSLGEHTEYLSVADQNLLQDHAERMVNHLEELAEVLSDTQTAIAIEEGEFDPEIHDVELARLFDVPIEEEDDLDLSDDDDLDEAALEHGEKPMAPIHGWGSEPKDQTFTVMGPLGVSRAGHKEKLVLATQLPRESTEDEDTDGDQVDEDEDDIGAEHFWKL